MLVARPGSSGCTQTCAFRALRACCDAASLFCGAVQDAAVCLERLAFATRHNAEVSWAVWTGRWLGGAASLVWLILAGVAGRLLDSVAVTVLLLLLLASRPHLLKHSVRLMRLAADVMVRRRAVCGNGIAGKLARRRVGLRVFI